MPADAATKAVLVSGAGGFIGGYTVGALLTRGYRVHGLSRGGARAPGGCTWHAVDLFEPTAVKQLVQGLRPTHLVHLAWETTHGSYWTSEENLRWVVASLELCRVFHAAGGQRFVGVGTCAEYSWEERALAGQPVHEDRTPRRPRTFYGIAKNATFDVLQAYATAAGLSLAWGRLFFPYGPGDRRPTLIPSVIRALRAGRPALCTHGRQRRDLIHARDAGQALAALLDSRVSGAVNIGTGIATSLAEVALQLGDLLGRPELVRLGALPSRPDEPAELLADVERLAHEVGYPPKITVAEGLRETVDWWGHDPPTPDS